MVSGKLVAGENLQINNCQFNNNGNYAVNLNNINIKTYTRQYR